MDHGPWTVVGVPWPVNHGPQTMDPGLRECKHQPIWLSSIVGLLDAGRDVLKLFGDVQQEPTHKKC